MKPHTSRVQSPPELRQGVLQRTCACGKHTHGSGVCEACQSNRLGTHLEHDPHAKASEIPPIVHSVLRLPGQPLDAKTKAFMEPRFGRDFSGVRVHTDAKAAESARAVKALAYTVGRDVVFASERYAPTTAVGRRLLAHELTHVVQQGRPTPSADQQASEHEAETSSQAVMRGDGVRVAHAASMSLQRAVEVRPPGRGEASAFDRRDELIDRMNEVSGGLTFRLDGRQILYDVRDESALTNFDRQMQGLIDRADVLPMRLITRAGRVQGDTGTFEPLLIDSFAAGYVDLDDMLSSDHMSFQMNLIHCTGPLVEAMHFSARL